MEAAMIFAFLALTGPLLVLWEANCIGSSEESQETSED